MSATPAGPAGALAALARAGAPLAGAPLASRPSAQPAAATPLVAPRTPFPAEERASAPAFAGPVTYGRGVASTARRATAAGPVPLGLHLDLRV